MKNSITDIKGITVGNADDAELKSGVTAIICDKPTIASCHVMGGAPGTRETDLLSPENSVEHVNGLFLSGGSAFGLDAGSGISNFLKEKKIGFEVAGQIVPIGPGAIIFDLVNGGNKEWGKSSPYQTLGYKAALSTCEKFEIGTIGAGTGATVAGLKGGLGTASTKLSNGVKVGALICVNALGSPTIGDTRHFWAAPFEQNDEFGGLGFPKTMPENAAKIRTKLSGPHQNTTIAVIATDAKLNKAEAKRLAISAHDGFARALYPSHTPMDGDLIFSLATGEKEIELSPEFWIDLCAESANVTARAIARGIYEARTVKNDIFPCWKEKYKT